MNFIKRMLSVSYLVVGVSALIVGVAWAEDSASPALHMPRFKKLVRNRDKGLVKNQAGFDPRQLVMTSSFATGRPPSTDDGRPSLLDS